MKNKKIVFLLNFLLVIIMFFSTLNMNSYALDDQKKEIFLYGFGDDYDGDDFLILNNTRTCYVNLKNIPFSEKENINLTIKDEDIAEIQEIVYGDNTNPVITAKIKGKKLGTTEIIASLTYNGDNYSSKIITTVRETNYRIHLSYEDGNIFEDDLSINIKKNEKLKLGAILYRGMAYRIGDVSSNGVIWSSSNESVANVDNKGLVTGVGKGTAIITAKYLTNEGVIISDSVNIEVKDESSSSEEAKIKFFLSIPEPAKVLNKEYGFKLYLLNIPDTEKENINFTIENENIAKITGIDLCNWEDGSGKGIIIANAKFLALGKTSITATLNYNGKTYSDTFDFEVIESIYSLSLSVKDKTDLPSSLDVGDKIQLTVMLRINGGSVLPMDVTTQGVIYTSSNEKVVKVDEKGLITAIGEGTATITAMYKVGDETISAKYDLKIIDSTKPSEKPEEPKGSDNPTKNNDPTTSPTIIPKTGENHIIMMITGMIFTLAVSFVMYKRYKYYKNIE